MDAVSNVIVALATAPMKSALALIRCSGDGVFEMTDQIFSHQVSGIKGRQIFLGHIRDNGEDIDLVEVLAYPGPKTMSGSGSSVYALSDDAKLLGKAARKYLDLGYVVRLTKTTL